MKSRSLIAKLLALFASIIMMLGFFAKPTKAMFYEKSENKVLSFNTVRKNNSVTVSIQYQNGIKNVRIYICNTASSCMTEAMALTAYQTAEKEGEEVINWNENEVARYTVTLNSQKKGTPLSNYNDTETNEYKVVIFADICKVLNTEGTKCIDWAEGSASKSEGIKYSSNFILDKGFTSSGELNSTLDQVLYIVNTIGIPILWGLLGVLLLVRGILLGMAIMKSGDEPEIRKKKIMGLVWLFIGVGIGYLVTILASYVMGMFGYGGIFA